MLGGLLLAGTTLFLMWMRTPVGPLQLDVLTTCIAGTLGAEVTSELELGLDANRLGLDGLGTVDALGTRLAGTSLALRPSGTESIRLRSIVAPPGSRFEIQLAANGRLQLAVQPPTGTGIVRAKVEAGPGSRALFDEEGVLARELDRSPVSALLVCDGAPGSTMSLVLDSTTWDDEPENLAGLSGLVLSDLDFSIPVHAAVEGLSRARSGVLEATCHVSYTGPEPVRVPRAGVLVADEWDGFVTALSLSRRALRFQWQGTARKPRSGHPEDPQPLLPVLFQRWLGHTPRAYVSLLLIYASLLPVIGILRGLLGHSDFKPSLRLEEPL